MSVRRRQRQRRHCCRRLRHAAAPRSWGLFACCCCLWHWRCRCCLRLRAVNWGRNRSPALQVALAAADGSATAEIYLHGATLTSWTVDGVERLFLSPNAVFAPPKAIRGGVPVCWPQFGMLGPLKAQHGFARNVRWEVAAVAAGGAACTLACESSAATLAEWPHPFRLEMEVSARRPAGGGGGMPSGAGLMVARPRVPAGLPAGLGRTEAGAARVEYWRGAIQVHCGSTHLFCGVRWVLGARLMVAAAAVS